MEGYMVYQFCLANYDDREEFLSRIKRFLNAYQKGMGDFQEHYMLDIYFKDLENNELLLVDIVPSIFRTVKHEYDLLSNKDSRELYTIVAETTEKFESELTEPEDYRIDQPTLVIRFRRLIKIISKEVFESQNLPFNCTTSK
ncbi:MAG: hypothetical protein FJX80_08145 [Bacteroidetes bacterium]|nr:hypothetical protein [Bacteroidota bacterium]